VAGLAAEAVVDGPVAVEASADLEAVALAAAEQEENGKKYPTVQFQNSSLQYKLISLLLSHLPFRGQVTFFLFGKNAIWATDHANGTQYDLIICMHIPEILPPH
jgi:hypothetical protein